MNVRLSYEQILSLHEALLTVYGWDPGIRDEARIRSAVEAPFQVLFGEEAYPSVALKGAVMCFELAEGQGFVDGNKRIGFHAAVTFLELNGGRVTDRPLDFDAMDTFIRTFSGRSFEEVATWFRTFVDGI